MIIHKTYQIRGYVSKPAYRRIEHVLRESAALYNAALEEWRCAYRAGRSVTLYSQYRELTAVRAEDDFWGSISVQVGRGGLRRMDRARQAFYRRMKDGGKPGYPRFKSGRRWHTIEFANVNSSMLKRSANGYVLGIKGLPSIRLRRSAALPETGLKSLSITLRGRRLFVNLTYAEERVERGLSDKPAAGIDMGIADRMALSDGTRIGRRRKPNARLKRAQRRLSNVKKGGCRGRERKRILANAQHRERVRNRNECHRVTTAIVRKYGLIALEDLPILNMLKSAKGTVESPGRNVAQKSGLNRGISEQTWGLIRQQLEYKAVSDASIDFKRRFHVIARVCGGSSRLPERHSA